jgi:hypothetical protein
MAEQASSNLVEGNKVGGATNISGSGAGVSGAVAGLADDVASQNAARANAQPIARGTKTSLGRIYGVGQGGQTDGGY